MRLEAENARLRVELETKARAESPRSAVVADEEEFVPLLRGGYPVRVTPLRARNLEEAKKILTLSDRG